MEATIIGYELNGGDNDSYMTGSCDKLFPELSDVPKCNVCGYRTDYRFTNPNFKLHRTTYDFSYTYDGIAIVSLKFKEFCNRKGYEKLVFVPLLKAPNFFQLNINGNVVDYTARLKENLCPQCKQYESIIGPQMALQEIDAPLPDGFYQSNLWFASGNEKSPVIIAAPETMQKMKAEKFKGIDVYHPIEKK